MALNLFDVEDAWMQGNVLFDETMQEFEEEWNRPLLQTMLAVDLFVNRDIYGGRDGSSIIRETPGDEEEIAEYGRSGYGTQFRPGEVYREAETDTD